MGLSSPLQIGEAGQLGSENSRQEADCRVKQQGKKAFIYVNDRLKLNALETISAITEGLGKTRRFD